MLVSVRWLIATAVVLLVFGLSWTVAETVYDLDKTTALEVAAVGALLVGLPLSWWSFRGQLLDEPAEVAWVTWRRVPAAPAAPLSRDADRARLEAAFGKGRPNVAVLTGPPGVGKTELAAEYARARIAEGWPMVAWVHAGTTEELLAGLLAFADALGLRVSDEGSVRACERLRQHPPAGTRPSVLVVDGVGDVDAVRPYLPDGEEWRVLVTSSAPGATRLGTEIAVGPLGTAEAAAETGLPPEVVTALGGLPVALAVAAATGHETRSSGRYLGRLRDVVAEGANGELPDRRYPLAAIRLALSELGFDTDPVTRRVLGLLAVLSPGGVARELLCQTGEPSQVAQALDRLVRWRLVSTRMDGDGAVLHELTRKVVVDRLRTAGTLPATVTSAAALLGRATFGEELAWDRRSEGDQLVAHIAALSTVAGTVTDELDTAARDRMLGLRHWATRQLGAVGDGARAVEMAEASRVACERLLGPEHPDTLAAADNLVIAYAAAGRSAEGIPLAETTLARRERVLGREHPDTLASRYSVAYAHEYAGRLDEAETLYDRALAGYTQAYGPDHPQTGTVGAALGRVRALRPVAAEEGRHRPSPHAR